MTRPYPALPEYVEDAIRAHACEATHPYAEAALRLALARAIREAREPVVDALRRVLAGVDHYVSAPGPMNPIACILDIGDITRAALGGKDAT